MLIRYLVRLIIGPYVELPSLHVLSCFLTRDDNDEFRDLLAGGPLVEAGHDLLDVGFHLVVGRDKHVDAILFDGTEILDGVDSSLIPSIC